MHKNIDQSNLPKDILDYVAFKESTSGNNDKNRNSDAGKFGWIYGITKLLQSDFGRLKIKEKLDTPESAARASTQYLTYLASQFHITNQDELYKAYNIGEGAYSKLGNSGRIDRQFAYQPGK